MYSLLQGDLSVALSVIVCLVLGRRDIVQGLHGNPPDFRGLQK
jgi:hypothetical protein